MIMPSRPRFRCWAAALALSLVPTPVATLVPDPRLVRPTRHPSSAPTVTPGPTATYRPTPAPTTTYGPSAQPTSFPTIEGIVPPSQLSNLVGGVTTPACLAFVGLVMGAYVFLRDERRAKRWVSSF